MEQLEGTVRRLAIESGAGPVAVIAGPLAGPAWVSIEPDRTFHAASTMKLPVLVELHRRAAAGDLALDDRLVVRNRFRSIADGSVYRLDPADDSERDLYALEGTLISLRELARRAIVVSSNLATNLLVDLLGAESISSAMAGLGMPSLIVRRGVEDGPAWEQGINNEVTARGLAALLTAIARGEVVSPAASAGMLAILEAQEFNEGIPSGLPGGTRVAHKTGSISMAYHDAGVVLPQAAPAYVIVVLTSGLDEDVAAPRLVGGIAAAVHAALAGPARSRP